MGSGTYTATVTLMEAETPMKATITDDGFNIDFTFMGAPISISSNGDGVTVPTNTKDNAKKTWIIELEGVEVMGMNPGMVTVTLSSEIDNQKLLGKVELEDLPNFNPQLSNITFTSTEAN